MASVVGKTIFSDGKGKLFFGYYKTDDAVEFVDYKTWKKLSFKDVSKGDTNKERVIKAIVKNQKQFNKKVDFNMWAKKQKRSFEDTMDWFIQNGWINNINKGGIKESIDVLSVNEDRNSNMFYVLYQKKGVFGKPAAAGYKDRKDAEKFAKSLGNNHNTMILDKQSMKNVKGVDVKEGKKRFKRQDGIGKSKYTISYHDGKKKHKDGSDFFDIKIFKNKKDLSDFVGSLVKQGYKLTNESVNEGQLNIGDTIKVKSGNSLQKLNTIDDKWKVIKKDNSTYTLQKVGSSMKVRHPQTKVDYLISRPGQSQLPFIVESVNESASREAMGIAALTGTRGSAVQDFIDKNRINSRKLFNALKKANLQGRINFASALSGKPGNPNEKLTIKLFGEDKSEVEKIKKQVGKNEIKFYDALSKVEKRLGSKYPKFLDTALKQLKQNPSSLKTNADKEEKLFNLVK